ncbi:MAG: hypothetical protein IKL24_06925 [Clostridia bacterium]|nr:hypothetical protein [Clostridia bacterium]
MDLVKKIWPTAFMTKKNDVVSLIIQLVILLVVCAVAGLIIGFLQAIPVVGIIFTLVGSLLGIYSLVGIILCILVFLGKA